MPSSLATLHIASVLAFLEPWWYGPLSAIFNACGALASLLRCRARPGVKNILCNNFGRAGNCFSVRMVLGKELIKDARLKGRIGAGGWGTDPRRPRVGVVHHHLPSTSWCKEYQVLSSGTYAPKLVGVALFTSRRTADVHLFYFLGDNIKKRHLLRAPRGQAP